MFERLKKFIYHNIVNTTIYIINQTMRLYRIGYNFKESLIMSIIDRARITGLLDHQFLRTYVTRIFYPYILLLKEGYELEFQYRWSKLFAKSKLKVLEYWKRFRFLDKIYDFIDLSKLNGHKIILDIGGGISTVLHYLEALHKINIDPLIDRYKRMYRYPQDVELIKGFGELLPFRNSVFDLCFCSNVLDHTLIPSMVLREIRRVLRSQGVLYLTVEIISEKEKSRNIKRDPAHPHTFSLKDVINKLEEHGFSLLFARVSPFIGLYDYVLGKNYSSKRELIIIATLLKGR